MAAKAPLDMKGTRTRMPKGQNLNNLLNGVSSKDSNAQQESNTERREKEKKQQLKMVASIKEKTSKLNTMMDSLAQLNGEKINDKNSKLKKKAGLPGKSTKDFVKNNIEKSKVPSANDEDLSERKRTSSDMSEVNMSINSGPYQDPQSWNKSLR